MLIAKGYRTPVWPTKTQTEPPAHDVHHILLLLPAKAPGVLASLFVRRFSFRLLYLVEVPRPLSSSVATAPPPPPPPSPAAKRTEPMKRSYDFSVRRSHPPPPPPPLPKLCFLAALSSITLEMHAHFPHLLAWYSIGYHREQTAERLLTNVKSKRVNSNNYLVFSTSQTNFSFYHYIFSLWNSWISIK